ncbi:hypothetical protein Tco_0652991 [Tanacetum coccineum]|uniref:Uncharacterized protein n=1 Tax=Tanacetum coccineum TaxID=301880 RepID=A0ABQ4WZB6_9ASTR
MHPLGGSMVVGQRRCCGGDDDDDDGVRCRMVCHVWEWGGSERVSGAWLASEIWDRVDPAHEDHICCSQRKNPQKRFPARWVGPDIHEEGESV